jgi:hypothetical protein
VAHARREGFYLVDGAAAWHETEQGSGGDVQQVQAQESTRRRQKNK